nr:MarR family winged helix-turn-helix transcriptional regulator [Janibacter cremeus]
MTPDEGPAWRSVRITARWAAVRRAAEARQQIRVAEGRLLWLLRDGEPRTLRRIAEELRLEQSTVNRQVHAALDAGVITRFRPEDSPAYLVQVSADGWSLLRSDLARQLADHEHALSALPAAEREAFLDHLDTFVDTLGTAADLADLEGQAPPGPS